MFHRDTAWDWHPTSTPHLYVAYAVAVALLDGDVLIDQFSADRINSDDVWNLINRTHIHHDKAYDE